MLYRYLHTKKRKEKKRKENVLLTISICIQFQCQKSMWLTQNLELRYCRAKCAPLYSMVTQPIMTWKEVSNRICLTMKVIIEGTIVQSKWLIHFGNYFMISRGVVKPWQLTAYGELNSFIHVQVLLDTQSKKEMLELLSDWARPVSSIILRSYCGTETWGNWFLKLSYSSQWSTEWLIVSSMAILWLCFGLVLNFSFWFAIFENAFFMLADLIRIMLKFRWTRGTGSEWWITPITIVDRGSVFTFRKEYCAIFE